MLTLASVVLAAAVGGSPLQVLRTAMSAPAHLSYVGEVQMLRFGPEHSDAAIFRIEHLAPNLTRRWYEAPQGLYGDSIISRGEQTYTIDAKRDTVVQAEDDSIDDQVAEDDNFNVLVQNYRAAFGPDETVAGRAARVVILTNKHTGEMTVRLKIDTQTGLVLDKEVFASDGSLVAQTHFEHIRYSRDIPKSVFDVPTGLKRTLGPNRSLPSNDIGHLLQSAGFHALGPKYLPEGFIPAEGDVSVVQGVRTLHLLYSDGIRTVSLFQNAANASVGFGHLHSTATKVGSHPAKYAQDGPTTLLAWSAGKLHFTLVGDLNRSELQKIAASVAP